jgi:hypothetical protein
MRKIIPNLFIVAGDGRNSGKTSMACRIIGQFRESGVTGVKLSPHFHEPSPGLVLIESGDGYNIFGESNLWSAKDTSRMLQSGAAKVFYSQVLERGIEAAFNRILDQISPGTPIVVESPSLIKYFEPGVFVIMIGSDKPGKEMNEIEEFTHLNCTVDEIDRTDHMPFLFTDGEWIIE